MDDTVLKLIQILGVPGLITFLAYKLLDKWFAQFLAVHDKQATAITDLAAAVKATNSGQADVIMAVRVLSGKVDDCLGWLRESGKGNES
jgi:hypothetical protein